MIPQVRRDDVCEVRGTNLEVENLPFLEENGLLQGAMPSTSMLVPGSVTPKPNMDFATALDQTKPGGLQTGNKPMHEFAYPQKDLHKSAEHPGT